MPRPRTLEKFLLPSDNRREIPALAAVALLLASPLSLAQSASTGSIAGRVHPAHDHDFVLSTARIPDLGLKTDVEAGGGFRFDDVRPGSYLVEVRVPSLGTVAERVTVRAGEETSADFELKAGSHSEEIVVTASADARDPFELASATTSLSGQELAQRLEASLGETLAGEPGVSSTFFGPGSSRPIIRGLAGDRVRMLEDGLGTGDASGVSADHAVTADPAQAERIEVVRGPGTLLYGSSAIGGVVNVIDERIPSVRATPGVHGTVELRGGTGSEERHGGLRLDGGGGDWAWHFDALARATGDYEVPGFARAGTEDGGQGAAGTPSGTVPNSDLETRGGRFGASHFFGDRGFVGVSVSGFESEYGLPGGLEEPGGDELEGGAPVRIDLEQLRFDLRAQIHRPLRGFQALKVRLGATDYEHVELEGKEEGTFFFNDALEARFELVQAKRRLPGGRVHGGSVGLQYFDRDLEAVGAEAFLPKTATDRWALFTLQELSSGALSWQFGARFERQDVTPAAGSIPARSHEGSSASAGLVWQTGGAFSIAASAARSVKLPAPEELYANGLHAATQAFEIGDPDLGVEVGLGLDLGFRVEAGRFSGELTLFRQAFDDFIFQAFTGDEEEGFPVVAYRQRDAIFAGAELQGRVEIFERQGRHLHLSFVGDIVEAELDAGGNLPRIPPLRLGGGVHYHSERWNGTAEVRWVDDQDDAAINESATGGHTMVHASLGHRLLFRNRIVDLLLRGRNLTDAEARSHTSFLKNVAPLPGRHLTLSLKLRF